MNLKPLLLLVPGLLLLGCSQNSVKNAESSAVSGVDVVELAADEFVISIMRNEPPMKFENRRLRVQAEQLCPTGYSYVLRQAHRNGEMAIHHAQCAAGADCSHELSWHIRCGHVPREPFRFFGRT
ncbi:hypothetical protein JX580_06800 [Thiomicrospira microaerophila]|uniref:hypothetical protein n=1 Tax=Thiomicrospira microaerophila TaxID=406020 RepID=UPI0020108705|nr:hypothetical protein [Thiomicrospira microaerophila]UQB41401.1 hypothetical protein JX580_06800 [Thiomicrospira microaerophila]